MLLRGGLSHGRAFAIYCEGYRMMIIYHIYLYMCVCVCLGRWIYWS
jgi:hypothetical protein